MVCAKRVGQASKRRRVIAKSLLALSSVTGVLLIAETGQASTFYWDGDGAGASGSPPTAGVGGAGNWDNISLKWWDGAAYKSWTAAGGEDVADFRGTAATVTIAAGTTVNANKLEFASTNYVIAGGDSASRLNLTGSGIIDISTLPTTKATITGVVSGTNGFTVNAAANTINQQLIVSTTFSGANSTTLSGVITLTG